MPVEQVLESGMNPSKAIDDLLGPVEVFPLRSTDQSAGGDAVMSRTIIYGLTCHAMPQCRICHGVLSRKDFFVHVTDKLSALWENLPF